MEQVGQALSNIPTLRNIIEKRKPIAVLHAPVPMNRNYEVTDTEIAENEARRLRVGYAPNPLCGVCHGSGFVNSLFDDGRVNYNRYVTCTAPDCLEDAKTHYRESGQYLELKGVSSRLQTFEQFKKREGSQTTYSAFHGLAQGTAKPLLLCYGANGCGKSHLCNALTTALIKRGIDAHLYDFPELVRVLRGSISQNNTDEWVQSLKAIDAFILDDYGLGMSKAMGQLETDWTMGIFEEIWDTRWENKLITAVATNWDLNDLSPRMRSRFSDVAVSVLVHNSASDYRVRGK